MITRVEIRKMFLTEATAHDEAIAIGDHKKANTIHKKLHNLYNQAKRSNASNVFSELLNEPDENVRLWAATFTLKVYPEISENL